MTGVVHVDTRQKAGHHDMKHGWLERHGVSLDFVALSFGDYMRDGSNVSVDTKQDLNEVAGNMGRDHRRVRDECDRAASAGYRLVFLVEAGSRYSDRSLIDTWRPHPCRRCPEVVMPCRLERCHRHKRRPMQGDQLHRIMDSMEARHGCVFEFCDKRQTGRRIAELLGLEVDDGE